MEADIPIDIHYNKLLDWLINRRHCPQQWQGSALTVREKINTAIQDMPPVEEITTLLQGTYINYFHCLRIVELLKDTESGSKNIFGRYSSQRMKDWQEILKLYEKEDTYLAEAAQLLTRNVNYEIPSLKKQISRCQQGQRDCTRKEAEYKSSGNELREKFASSCKMMGIEGKKLKQELFALVKDMPATYDGVVRASQKLDHALNYYTDFINFTLKSEKSSGDILSALDLIRRKGNITTYEYRTGHMPTRVEDSITETSFTDEDETTPGQEEELEIDWGGDEVGDGEIDFGDEVEIDWGDTGDVSIEVVGDETADITTSADEGDGVARGDDALSILDNTKTRNKFLNDVMELESFLVQRLAEVENDDDVLGSILLQSAPETIHKSREELEVMVATVRDVLELLTSNRTQELLLIRSSPRYLERLAAKLKKNLDDAEKYALRARLMVTRRQEALEEEKQTQPRLDLIRQRTMELKKQIEGEISKKYKNRRVNIMGEINTI